MYFACWSGLDDLGIARSDGGSPDVDPRRIWKLFAQNFHLFRGTPSSMWLNHSFEHVFDIDIPLNGDTADEYYDHIDRKLADDSFRPRALFERFGIECLATTEGALDGLESHKLIKESGWSGRVITTYRPDAVVDPEFEGFAQNISAFAINGDDGPLTSHVPFLLSNDGKQAELHLVRSNPIARACRAPLKAVITVNGPDSYISPDCPTSPYVRKVLVLLRETGQLDDLETTIVAGTPVDPGTMPRDLNPLGKIPALALDDGQPIYDSRVICRYLDDRAKSGLYGDGNNTWQLQTLEATADGILDAAILMVYEARVRPEDKQYTDWIEGQWRKIGTALDALEASWMETLTADGLNIGQIAVGCALGYLDLRSPERNWRKDHPNLAAWEAEFAKRDSMVATDIEIDGEDPDCVQYLASIDGIPAATARVKPIGTTAKIQRVAVLDAHRGTGLGAELMRFVLNDVSRDFKEALLGSQVHAIGFYEKLGFEAFGPEFDDAGIPHREMVLKFA
ncbi:Uronate isomerase [Nymphon striatum]|nr:Uronate isomerase [Nymphon striatum]